jgi:upstream-binding transcription factor
LKNTVFLRALLAFFAVKVHDFFPLAEMGRKRKSDDVLPLAVKTKAKPAKNSKKSKKSSHNSNSDVDSDTDMPKDIKAEGFMLDFDIPPKEVMSRLLDNIEAQLPKEDHVKYDSRAKKLDWDKIKFDEYSAEQCKKLWHYVQDRIRRFRIMSELIPDARTWISHPWTNFYKSKDHNRHPDMPKKPLSMYMLFYSEKREQILSENRSLSMPEVAKICSEQYQKLSDKKKARYKQRCDDMRVVYDEKLSSFYTNYPDLKPVKAEKTKKPKLNNPVNNQQQSAMNTMPLMQYANNQQQPQMITIGTGQNQQLINLLPMQQDQHQQMYTVVQQQPQQQQMHQQQMRPMTSNAPASVLAQVQPQHQQQQQQQNMNSYPSAPEKPAKPFDLYFKHQMDSHAGDTNFDRQSYAEQCRQDWKTMKLKKKAKWIKKAADNYREYEEKVAEFIAQNPGYVRPQQKNFLTQEDQRILDKYMGRPEKPPSSAYSLFSKEMLNNVEIKKFPSKERMAQISEKWKILPQEQKDW